MCEHTPIISPVLTRVMSTKYVEERRKPEKLKIDAKNESMKLMQNVFYSKGIY